MDFLFDESEDEVIQEARRALRHALPVARFHQGAAPVSSWAELGRLGWLSLALPVSAGGGGASTPLVAAVMADAGRALAVDDFVNNAYLLPALIASAEPSQVSAWLDRQQQAPGFVLADPPAGDGSVRCFGVSNGFDAYRLAPGGRLERWDASAVSARAVAGLSLGMADVTVAGPPADTVDIDAAALAHVHEVAGLFQAAALVGLAAEALAQTVDYVQQREQFGGPIGRFQAVKHLIADVYARNEAASSSVLFAAAALEARDMDAADKRFAVSCARVLGLRAGLGASKTMAQLFGGIGYTWEVDVHWFLKTALDACARFGGIDAAARAVGEQLVASSC